MNRSSTPQTDRFDASGWLRSYYFTRAAVAAAWVVAAFTLGRDMPAVAAALLIAYPAWDAIANLIDARRSGGLKSNPSQALNVAISAVTTVAVIVALAQGLHAVLAAFGVWAVLAGVLQLLTGLRRWPMGSQWPMTLSGAQSALAGAFFLKQATGAAMPGITDIAPYAAFGAFYFLVSAVWLTVTLARKSAPVRA